MKRLEELFRPLFRNPNTGIGNRKKKMEALFITALDLNI